MQHEASADTAATDAHMAGRRDEGTTTGDQAAKTLKDLRFELLRSALYHDLCQQRSGRIHRGLTFANVILGSGAIAGFGAQNPQLGQLAGVAVAAIAGLQLVWDFGGAAHCHGALRRRFYDLLADLDDGVSAVTVQARQTRIFSDEPPMDYAVNKIADQRAGLSIYGDAHRKL